jgi:response regulator RpfG family c-di-GMP phosphodiesterase
MDKGLLIVDDEPNILNSLTRLLRREGYRIHTASRRAPAFEILEKENIGVIIADQRMPEMTGAEFLEHAKRLKPTTVGIILSGYTELQSVTEAINRGAVYKFLIKPWDDTLLCEQVREAFSQHELRLENAHLTDALKKANAELSSINANLERVVLDKTREALSNVAILQVAQEILDSLPIGVVGIAEDGLIATANECAMHLLEGKPFVGQQAAEALPAEVIAHLATPPREAHLVLNGKSIRARYASLGKHSAGRGIVILLIPEP